MAILSILQYPDPRLYTVAKPVGIVDDNLRCLVADMAETMYAAPGIGLSATQVDVHSQILIMDISETRDQLEVFINPRITKKEGSQEYQEGCLSVPGVYEKITRCAVIEVSALNEKGEPFVVILDGLKAVCVQHEMDHLLGKVFVQYLSPLKQSRIRTRLKKSKELVSEKTSAHL